MTQFKTFPGLVKAAGPDDGLGVGEFEAYVAVFGNKDSYGDVIMPGAFADALAAWDASGDPIPVYWSHRMDDPDYNIGHVLEAAELAPGDARLPAKLRDLGGLWVRALLDLDDPAPTSKAPQVHRLLKGRRVTQFSFAYDVPAGGRKMVEEEDGGWFFELHKIFPLHEVGPTPIGANQETELLGVKQAALGVARDLKAGRTLSSKNESALREARDAIDSVLSSVAAGDDEAGDGKTGSAPAAPGNDQEKASGAADAKPDAADEDPARGKSAVSGEELTSVPSASTLAATINLYAAAYGPGE